MMSYFKKRLYPVVVQVKHCQVCHFVEGSGWDLGNGVLTETELFEARR